MRKGRNKSLPAPGGRGRVAGRGGCNWCGSCPCGVVRLSPPVLSLVEHVMKCWNDLVRCVRDPAIPSDTNLLEGWFGRSGPGHGWPAA